MSDVERFKMVAVPVAYLRWLERMAAVGVSECDEEWWRCTWWDTETRAYTEEGS